jgi:hypothetical protein
LDVIYPRHRALTREAQKLLALLQAAAIKPVKSKPRKSR